MRKFIEEELLAQIFALEGNLTEQVKKCTQLFTVLTAGNVTEERKTKLSQEIGERLQNTELNASLKAFLQGGQHYCKKDQTSKDQQAIFSAFQTIAVGEEVPESYVALGQYLMGYCQEMPLGTNEDANEAFKNYQLAADKKLAVAETAVGRCYQFGIGVEEDTDAIEYPRYYNNAIKQNEPDAMWRLGWIRMAAQKPDKAHELWKKAGMLGHLTALMNIAEVSTGLAKHQYDLLISMQPYAGFIETAQQIDKITQSYLSPTIDITNAAQNTTATSVTVGGNSSNIWGGMNSWNQNPEMIATANNTNSSSNKG